jgi:hypothetical protein
VSALVRLLLILAVGAFIAFKTASPLVEPFAGNPSLPPQSVDR